MPSKIPDLAVSLPNLNDLFNLYSLKLNSIEKQKAFIISEILAGNAVPPIFHAKTINEVKKYFDECVSELNYSISFNIIAVTEATIRHDFYDKVTAKHKRKNPLIKEFIEIFNQHGNTFRFEDNILDTWKTHLYTNKHYVSEYKSLLKFRHWIAHGRYFKPKHSNPIILPNLVLNQTNLLLAEMRAHI